MLKMERINILLDYLYKHSYAPVKKIAKEIYMSETTVRRDLAYLETQNMVKRNYGGAILNAHYNKTLPFDIRLKENELNKQQIAEKAVSLIKQGDTIFLDESSTTCSLINYLRPEMELTIVTNSIRAINQLSEKNIRTYCTGGLLHPITMSFHGTYAEKTLENINGNLFFFSTSGMSSEGFISDRVEDNAKIKLLMLRRAAKSAYLCDCTKFDSNFLASVCHISDVTYFITDKRPSDKICQMSKNLIV